MSARAEAASGSAGEIALKVPDLGLGQAPIMLTVWHVKRGDAILGGERLVELVADCVAIDLPSPATGRIEKLLVAIDEPVTVGQALAILSAEEPGGTR